MASIVSAPPERETFHSVAMLKPVGGFHGSQGPRDHTDGDMAPGRGSGARARLVSPGMSRSPGLPGTRGAERRGRHRNPGRLAALGRQAGRSRTRGAVTGPEVPPVRDNGQEHSLLL